MSVRQEAAVPVLGLPRARRVGAEHPARAALRVRGVAVRGALGRRVAARVGRGGAARAGRAAAQRHGARRAHPAPVGRARDARSRSRPRARAFNSYRSILVMDRTLELFIRYPV